MQFYIKEHFLSGTKPENVVISEYLFLSWENNLEIILTIQNQVQGCALA